MSYELMGLRLLSTLHLLASMLRSFIVDIMTKKTKIIFQTDSGAHFSVLPFSPGPQSNDKVIIQDKSGQPASLPGLWPALGEISSSVTLSS
jgi:hypothetical protein